jgi:hypothetical protein
MFEKIGRYAERLATSAGQSRRGFLGRLGKGALGVAGVVSGLLILPGEARASKTYCEYKCTDGSIFFTVCPCQPSVKHGHTTCFPFEGCGLSPQAGTIRIEVWDGVVQNVSNVPPGWDYEIVDYDHLTSWRGSFDE